MISQSIRRRLTASGKVKELTLSKYSETVSPASNYSGLFIYVLYGDEIPTSSPTITNSASSWIYSVNWDSSNGRIVIGYRANEDESNDRTGIITVTYEGKSAQFYLTQSKDYVSERGVLRRGGIRGDSISSISLGIDSSYIYTGIIEPSRNQSVINNNPAIASISASYTIKFSKFLVNTYASGKSDEIIDNVGSDTYNVVLSNFDSFNSGEGSINELDIYTYNYPTSTPWYLGYINCGIAIVRADRYHYYHPSSSKVTISPEFDYSIPSVDNYDYDYGLVIAYQSNDEFGGYSDRYFAKSGSGNGTTYEYQYPLIAVFNNSNIVDVHHVNYEPTYTISNYNCYVTVVDSYKNKTASITARIA